MGKREDGRMEVTDGRMDTNNKKGKLRKSKILEMKHENRTRFGSDFKLIKCLAYFIILLFN
jgi:hypothetical protein